PRAVLVGHSWGASVALRYAVLHPAEVLGVVCVDGGAADLRSVFGDTWAVAEQAMRPPDLDGVRRDAVVAMALSSPLVADNDPDDVVEIMLGNFEEVSPGRLRPRLRVSDHMQIARALYDLDSAALIAAQPHPLRFLLAAQSARGGAERRARLEAAVAAGGDRVDLRWIDGGHDLPVERPSEVAEGIADFVARLLRP